MGMVPVGVTSIVLHVPNQGILPIDHVEGSIGSKFQIDWAKIGIRGKEKVLPVLGRKTGVSINDCMLFNP